MAGEDLTSSLVAPPPREPLPESALDRETLRRLGDDIVRRTWADGLPSWFWGEGVCLTGMIAFADAFDTEFPDPVLDWLDHHHGRGIGVEHVNNVAPGTAAALAVARGHERFAPVAQDLVAWASSSPAATRTSDGVLEHWPGGVWADTAFMAGQFLAHWAVVTRDANLFAEAVRQVVGHYRVLQHPETDLCVHGSHRGETIWCYWGRANAWLALAAVEVLRLAGVAGVAGVAGRADGAGAGGRGASLVGEPVDVLLRELEDRLSAQLDALCAAQPSYGVWDVLVDGQVENRGLPETSAAAGIGAALLRADALLGRRETWRAAGRLAVRGALAHIDDGALTRVSAGTVLQLVPFGYSVIRDDRPQLWGQGLALHAIAAAAS